MPDIHRKKKNKKEIPPRQRKTINRLFLPSLPCPFLRHLVRALCTPTLRPSAAVTCGPAVLPTSVVARKSRIALLHHSAFLVRVLSLFQDGSPESSACSTAAIFDFDIFDLIPGCGLDCESITIVIAFDRQREMKGCGMLFSAVGGRCGPRCR